MSHLVFVYGSLKSGFHNHRPLVEEGATDLGNAMTNERYMLGRGAAFPFLIDPKEITPHENEQDELSVLCWHVKGELYLVDDETLARLDRLEGHPTFYRRKLIELAAEDMAEPQRAWAYFLTRPADRFAGDWTRVAMQPLAGNDAVEWKREDVFADEEE